ncbi:hypothetical protein D3C72_2318570 [compost metagenome]
MFMAGIIDPGGTMQGETAAGRRPFKATVEHRAANCRTEASKSCQSPVEVSKAPYD